MIPFLSFSVVFLCVTFCDVSGIRDENSDDQRGNGKTIDQRKIQDARAVEKGIEGVRI